MKSNWMKIIAVMTVLALMAVSSVSFAMAEAGAPIYSADDLFTNRDLKQEADLKGAVTYTLSDGQDITITAAGVYVLKGNAKNVTVFVEATKEDKVQIVLDGVTVTNDDFPVIYAKKADKVFVTTSADSTLSVVGKFSPDGTTKTDAVIFSKCDLVMNGTAVLTISSTDTSIECKDDLKITGGSYVLKTTGKAIQANDSIRIYGGTLDINAGSDGIYAKNSDDDTLGYIYIGGGDITIQAGDDGLRAETVVQIDGGTVSITAPEGIEGTYVQINGGIVTINAADDGINAGEQSSAYTATVEINGGELTITMGSGDTDGIDSNGNIIVNGGIITVTGTNTFDYDGEAQFNGGTIIVNGEEVDAIPNQTFGGRGGQGVQDGWR